MRVVFSIGAFVHAIIIVFRLRVLVVFKARNTVVVIMV